MRKEGVLPSQKIKELIKKGFIKNAKEKNINPASLDLTITKEIYRTEEVFQPRSGEEIRKLLKKIRTSVHDLTFPLEKDVIYLARLKEMFNLPKNIYGYCNPKSSTGRIDVHVRLLADGVARYDALTPAGYKGEVWLVIIPKSFPIKIKSGETLTQVRFFNGDTRFNELELQTSFEKDKLLWFHSENRILSYSEIKIKDNDGSLILTLDLTKEIVGYKSKQSNRILDLSKKGLNPYEFFEPIKLFNNYLHLKKGEFYIFSTREAVRVPSHLVCEMVPMDERSGEFRAHYAGFIDPGWGFGKKGEGRGRPLTLEIRPFEDLNIRDNQPIVKIRFEKMIEIPNILYDTKPISSYTNQDGPRLSKYFKI